MSMSRDVFDVICRETSLQTEAANFLGANLSQENPNMRYLTLEAMSHLSGPALDQVKKYQNVILESLKDNDVSIRMRALGLLYVICDKTNAKEIVQELLNYLHIAQYQMREEMVLKIAVLAETYAPSLEWYVDVILRLIRNAGDFVSDEIWHRLVQIITNNEAMQYSAANMLLNALKEEGPHQMAIKGGAYILGEFGHVLVDKDICRPEDLVNVLRRVYVLADQNAKAIIITALGKIMSIFGGDIKAKIVDILTPLSSDMHTDIQQRAIEVLALAHNDNLAGNVFAEMPVWPERESALLALLNQSKGQTEGVTWKDPLKEKQQQQIPSAPPAAPVVVAAAPSKPVEDLLSMETKYVLMLSCVCVMI